MFKKNLCFILFVLLSFSLFADSETSVAGSQSSPIDKFESLYFNPTTKELDVLYVIDGELKYKNMKPYIGAIRSCMDEKARVEGTGATFTAGPYHIDHDGDGNASPFWCDSDGWTLVAKINGSNKSHQNSSAVGGNNVTLNDYGKFSDEFINQFANVIGDNAVYKFNCGQGTVYFDANSLEFKSTSRNDQNIAKVNLGDGFQTFDTYAGHLGLDTYNRKADQTVNRYFFQENNISTVNNVTYGHSSVNGCFNVGNGWDNDGSVWLGK